MPPPIRRRAGSSAAAGTRSCGRTRASRPPPTSTQSSVTGRSWLGRVDGHALVANSAAMRAAGVTAATPAPSGGRIENGLFVDNAMSLVESKVPPPTPAEADAALAKAQEILLGYRPHRRRRHGHGRGRLGGDEPRRRSRAGSTSASCPMPRHCLRSKPSAAARRPTGCSATGCAWAASSSMPTARSARAAPG